MIKEILVSGELAVVRLTWLLKVNQKGAPEEPVIQGDAPLSTLLFQEGRVGDNYLPTFPKFSQVDRRCHKGAPVMDPNRPPSERNRYVGG